VEDSAKNDIVSSADLAATAELAYLDHSGNPRVRSITPVVSDGAPAFTLTYAEAEAAREINASPEVCLVFSDSRLAYAGWKSLFVSARTRLAADPKGDDFLERFLEQELRKHPPSRLYMDTLVLRRENWWYTPRLMLFLEDFGESRQIARRSVPKDTGVLAWNSEDGLRAETVEVGDWEAERMPLRHPDGETAFAGADAPAALLFHDFSVPDMEQETSLYITGRLSGGRLSVENREGSRELPALPGLISRFKFQRSLKKRCAAGLEEHEARRS
jgi:hypothetical protein